MTSFRRKEDSTTWHWCANCSQYPTGKDVIQRHTKPEYGDFCRECEVLEKAGDCRRDSFFSVRK